MDPFAHTFTGAALAAAGLRKATPLATAALLIGVNAPDIDILVAYGGEYMSLAHRRGWTHGVLAWAILPLLVTGMLLAWDRWVRRRQDPAAAPVSAGRLLLISALAVLTHPALDWLNNYGIRLLMPFDGRWFYGDAVFIIDPWIWLLMGGACFLCWSRDRAALAGWGLFWGAASLLVVFSSLVSAAAAVLWFVWLGFLLAGRLLLPVTAVPFLARCALVVVAGYSTTNALASLAAERQIGRDLRGAGSAAAAVMVGPLPANPFRGNVVVETGDGYILGQWHWLTRPRLTLGEGMLRKNLASAPARAAAEHPHARRFLAWSRFPYATVEPEADGFRVTFGDARYAGFDGGIPGPALRLGANLTVIE